MAVTWSWLLALPIALKRWPKKSPIKVEAAEACPCDIGDGEALAKAVTDAAERHGRFDILVNNAGITRDDLLLRMSDDAWDEVIHVNLRSAFVACRAAVRPMMRGRFGRIINVGSVSGVMGNPGQANYAAAKAGMIGFTKTIGKEFAGKGVTANVVAPGFIATDMTDALPDQSKKRPPSGFLPSGLGLPKRSRMRFRSWPVMAPRTSMAEFWPSMVA